ncbi:hypothetical protein BDW75DRAFT_246232 [Aspergillus navahoensis]
MVKHTDLIQVNPMERSEVLELLQKTLDQDVESQESQQLVEELECMPLVMVQAASYIRERGNRYSIAQYLRDFRKSDREATNLLKKEAGHLGRDWEAKNSVFTTWQISFDYLRREKPSAAELLSLMSFFDRQGIPEDIIRPRLLTSCTARTEVSDDSSDGETSESGSDGGPDFEDDVATLRNYSFILNDGGKDLYVIYPTSFLRVDMKTGVLFPHVRAAMAQRPESREPLLRWATLLYRGAWYASTSGNIADAKEMASKSHKQRLKLLGAQAEEALASTAMLAEAYSLEGRWDEAEQLQVQVMETRKMKLGAEHPGTLRSMASLASMYWKQGRWEEAEQLLVHVMETRKTKLRAEHPDTLTSMANLAFTWKSSGHNTRALDLLRDCLAKQRQILGLNQPVYVSNSQTLLEWETEILNL